MMSEYIIPAMHDKFQKKFWKNSKIKFSLIVGEIQNLYGCKSRKIAILNI